MTLADVTERLGPAVVRAHALLVLGPRELWAGCFQLQVSLMRPSKGQRKVKRIVWNGPTLGPAQRTLTGDVQLLQPRSLALMDPEGQAAGGPSCIWSRLTRTMETGLEKSGFGN